MPRGQKPMPPALRGIKGGKKSDQTENPAQAERRTEPLIPPRELNDTQQKAWDEHVHPAWWLQQNDVPLAFQWACMYARFIDEPGAMNASELSEMRKAYHQLCLSSSEQVRAGVHESPEGEGKGRFFERNKA